MKSDAIVMIRRIFHTIIFCVFMVMSGCRGGAQIDLCLDKAHALMENSPDSALVILDSIDVSVFGDKVQKARYALLKSVALDKNYKDATTFDVLQPAIDYYLDKGNPDEKLRTYYYQGRIYQNRNDRDSAIFSFMRGLDIAGVCDDSLTLARTFIAQGILYKDYYDIPSFVENYLKAAMIYKNETYKSQELDCLMNAFSGMILLRDKERADSIIKIIEKFDLLEEEQQQIWDACKLSYEIQFGKKNELSRLIEKNHSNMIDANGKLNLALAYNRVGDNFEAKSQLDWLDEAKCEYDTLKYLSIKFAVLEDMNDHENALLTYKDYINRLETINSAKFEQMSSTMEERHRMELEAERTANEHSKVVKGYMVGVGFLLMGIAILILINHRNKTRKNLALQKARTTELENQKLKTEQENLVLENRNLELERNKRALEVENLAHRVETLESESENLRQVLESQHEEMAPEVRQAIQTRIEMLNAYLASQITDNDDYAKTYDKWVEQVTADSKQFMDSNRLAFQASHPAFIKYFEDHGLTESEINYVCLYAIGLRGKEVGNYMKMRSHVNVSSAIRKKLGIDRHETNIGIYVRKLLKNL